MQLELFDKHLKDLSFKNKKLSSTLKEIQAEEESCERELNQLDKEKAELAQRLAEVTQTAHAKQKFIAQLCARRQTVVDSLAKMHQDAQEYQVGQQPSARPFHRALLAVSRWRPVQRVATDLDLRRRKLNEQYCELADEENVTDGRLRELDQQRRKKYADLEGTADAINQTQAKVMENIPQPSLPPDVDQVNAVCAHFPIPAVRARPRLNLVAAMLRYLLPLVPVRRIMSCCIYRMAAWSIMCVAACVCVCCVAWPLFSVARHM